jgi:hypothetical protein
MARSNDSNGNMGHSILCLISANEHKIILEKQINLSHLMRLHMPYFGIRIGKSYNHFQQRP